METETGNRLGGRRVEVRMGVGEETAMGEVCRGGL